MVTFYRVIDQVAKYEIIRFFPFLVVCTYPYCTTLKHTFLISFLRSIGKSFDGLHAAHIDSQTLVGCCRSCLPVSSRIFIDGKCCLMVAVLTACVYYFPVLLDISELFLTYGSRLIIQYRNSRYLLVVCKERSCVNLR